jgi:drug/metabolite transporter (DMT)-like permease
MLSAWFLQERVTTLDWLTILLVFSGMGVFFFERLTVEGFWGNICAIVGGMAFAWVVLCLRKQQGTSLLETILLGNMVAAALGAPFMFRTLPGLSDWLALLLSGTVQIGLAFVLYTMAIRSVSALEAILIPVIEPLLNPLWVFLLLGEVPSVWTVIGGLIVVVSVTARGLICFWRERAASEAQEICYNQRPNVLS